MSFDLLKVIFYVFFIFYLFERHNDKVLKSNMINFLCLEKNTDLF